MISNFLSFIQKSPSAFHAVEQICLALQAKGFQPLNEMQDWAVQPGGKYYVTRNQSSVIAFTTPRFMQVKQQAAASNSITRPMPP